jgi:hypothetical protein
MLRIRDVYSGSWFLPIPDPGSKNSYKREGKKIYCHTFFVVTNFTKFYKFILFLKMLKRKIWANFQRIIEPFTQNLSLSSQKYGFGIRDPVKTYSGSRIQGTRGQKGTRSRIRNTEKKTNECFFITSPNS